MKNHINPKIKNCVAMSVLGLLLSGCITHKSVVYQDVERVKVEFESDAAARLFYETLSRNTPSPTGFIPTSGSVNHSGCGNQ